MKKYISFCKNHDCEGMRRETQAEAQLDLDAHIKLFPSESHNDSGVKEEDDNNKSLNLENEHRHGSTHANCDRNGCMFHRGVDSFTAGRDGVRVSVEAIPDGVRVNHVEIKNTSGGRNYTFTGQEVTRLGGSSKLVEKGNYRIIPSYTYVDTGGPRRLTLFVHW